MARTGPKRGAAAKADDKASKKLKLNAPGSMENMKLPADLEGKLDFKPDIKTTDNRPWNLKIISWNVNGIRAVQKKGYLSYLKFEDADIVCLQETKCQDQDIPMEAKFTGYHRYFNAAAKKGYSSTALYSKVKPLNVTYGIGKAEHDSEGRVITVEYTGFYLVNVYVPNSGRQLVRLSYRRKWNTDFLEYCRRLDAKKPLIVTGDMNVSHKEIDLANPKSNVKNSGFTPEEREDFGTWLDSGFVDSYRHFNPEKTGAYTFWTYMGNARARNVGWRLDYFIVSQRFMSNVASNMIRNIVKGSDHCPIMLLMVDENTPVEDSEKHDEEKTDKVSDKEEKDLEETSDINKNGDDNGSR